MSFRNLKIFMEVYRESSITKAASNLYLTQPAVSKAIKDIEKEYDVILFERLNKKLIRTEAADTLYMKLLPIIEGYDSLKDVLQKESESSTFHLGTNSTIGKYILPSLLSTFQKQHPSIKIYVTVENEETLQQKLEHHELDLCLFENNIQHKDFITEFLIQSPLSVISSKKSTYPDTCTLKQLSTFPLLLREKGSAQRNYIDAIFESNHISIDPIWESSTTDVLIEAVKNNLGISIVPTISIQKEKDIKIISLKKNPFIRNCYVVYHKDKYLHKDLKELIFFIHTKVGDIHA